MFIYQSTHLPEDTFAPKYVGVFLQRSLIRGVHSAEVFTPGGFTVFSSQFVSHNCSCFKVQSTPFIRISDIRQKDIRIVFMCPTF